jgi:hypothetical protein
MCKTMMNTSFKMIPSVWREEEVVVEIISWMAEVDVIFAYW